MDIRFDGQVAVVTGATRGIGLGISLELVRSGCQVIGLGSSEASVEKCIAENKNFKENLEFVPVDLGDERSIRNFVSSLDRPIDILINNAGINKVSPLRELSMEDWDLIQKINVRAPMLLTQLLVPQMMEQGFGRVLNITSIFAHLSKVGRASYSTSKSALLGMMRAVALESASRNVLVNSLSPGFIDTELTRRILSPEDLKEMIKQVPKGSLGQVEEIAQMACFMVSRNNSFMTGQALVVDGGFSIA